MISIDFCEKMSHATTRLDVFRHAVVSTPTIFFPGKPDIGLIHLESSFHVL